MIVSIFEVFMYQANKVINYWNNREYQMGFDAHALGEPLDKAQSEAWQLGWHGWDDEINKSETAQFYY